MSQVPTRIRALKDELTLELTWPDGRVDRVPFLALRCACPCAGCVDEFTGERRLDPTTVPIDVAPAEITLSGNYALKIHWNDGHSTGLYSWIFLRREADALTKGTAS